MEYGGMVFHIWVCYSYLFTKLCTSFHLERRFQVAQCRAGSSVHLAFDQVGTMVLNEISVSGCCVDPVASSG